MEELIHKVTKFQPVCEFLSAGSSCWALRLVQHHVFQIHKATVLLPVNITIQIKPNMNI